MHRASAAYRALGGLAAVAKARFSAVIDLLGPREDRGLDEKAAVEKKLEEGPK